MKTILWLDDIRNPYTHPWRDFIAKTTDSYVLLGNIIWVKSYQEFIDWITKNGMPAIIFFDHDLGLDLVHEKKTMSKSALKRHRKTTEYKTGMDCAKWIVEYCMDNDCPLPLWAIQSSNPAGKANIDGLLRGYLANYIK